MDKYVKLYHRGILTRDEVEEQLGPKETTEVLGPAPPKQEPKPKPIRFIVMDPFSAYCGEMVELVRQEGDIYVVAYRRELAHINFPIHKSKLANPTEVFRRRVRDLMGWK